MTLTNIFTSSIIHKLWTNWKITEGLFKLCQKTNKNKCNSQHKYHKKTNKKTNPILLLLYFFFLSQYWTLVVYLLYIYMLFCIFCFCALWFFAPSIFCISCFVCRFVVFAFGTKVLPWFLLLIHHLIDTTTNIINLDIFEYFRDTCFMMLYGKCDFFNLPTYRHNRHNLTEKYGFAKVKSCHIFCQKMKERAS